VRLTAIFLALLFGASAAPAADCIRRPCSSATNWAADIIGQIDTRPGTWGTAASVDIPLSFKNVPAGYRVRIERVYGDLVAWPKVAPDPGTNAGVLLGMSTTAIRDEYLVPAQDTCFAYFQGVLNGPTGTRIPFDVKTAAGGLLEPDSVLLTRVATFLSTLGVPVHAELTFTAVFRFEKSEAR